MPGLSPADTEQGVRRRRIVFRAWHRGTREMDLIMGQFADAHAAELNPQEVDEFEHLMDAPDDEVFHWVTGAKPTPGNYETALLQRIRAFHSVARLHD